MFCPFCCVCGSRLLSHSWFAPSLPFVSHLRAASRGRVPFVSACSLQRNLLMRAMRPAHVSANMNVCEQTPAPEYFSSKSCPSLGEPQQPENLYNAAQRYSNPTLLRRGSTSGRIHYGTLRFSGFYPSVGSSFLPNHAKRETSKTKHLPT